MSLVSRPPHSNTVLYSTIYKAVINHTKCFFFNIIAQSVENSREKSKLMRQMLYSIWENQFKVSSMSKPKYTGRWPTILTDLVIASSSVFSY